MRAGNLSGGDVLVTGGGPIGQLLVLVARHGGAAHVALTDMVAAPLAIARRIGADEALNVGAAPESWPRPAPGSAATTWCWRRPAWRRR